MAESEYEGLVITNDPDGCRLPAALSSETARVSVPFTVSPGGNDAPKATSGSTYVSASVTRKNNWVAVPVLLLATSVLASRV